MLSVTVTLLLPFCIVMPSGISNCASIFWLAFILSKFISEVFIKLTLSILSVSPLMVILLKESSLL